MVCWRREWQTTSVSIIASHRRHQNSLKKKVYFIIFILLTLPKVLHAIDNSLASGAPLFHNSSSISPTSPFQFPLQVYILDAVILQSFVLDFLFSLHTISQSDLFHLKSFWHSLYSGDIQIWISW